MVERYRLRYRLSPETVAALDARIEPKAKPSRAYFTDAAVARLKPKKRQYLVWDSWPPSRTKGADIAKGLCVLVSPGGAKSFRACFYFPGSPKPNYIHLGRVGEMSLAEARRRTGEVRNLARQGRDPRAGDPARSGTFETVFRDFIAHEQIGARNNKSALKTQGFVLANCRPILARPVAAIQYSEIEKLLYKIRDGEPGEKKPRPAASVRIFAHLRDFFSYCARPDGPIKVSPLAEMKAPTKLVGRERVYSGDEIKAIWRAAEGLDPLESGYLKLIFLTALRREELAQAKWSEFDSAEAPTLFTVPFERTKAKIDRKRRSYLVPLPPLAQRIVRSLPRHDAEAVFKRIDFARLRDRLVALGAPPDFQLHVARHTVATWLQNAGHTEYDVALVLNHSSSTVTAGYSHGYPLDRKRQLLSEWADYVEKLIQPAEGVSVLR